MHHPGRYSNDSERKRKPLFGTKPVLSSEKKKSAFDLHGDGIYLATACLLFCINPDFEMHLTFSGVPC